MNINPAKWGWNEWKAAGRHVSTFVAGGISVAVAVKFLSPGDAQLLTDNVAHITTGLKELAEGVAGLIAFGISVRNMLAAKSAAEPANQVIAVATNLRKNGSADVPSPLRNEIIGAVATMPEVRGVVVSDPALATSIPERNVVAHPLDLTPPAKDH